MPNDAKPSERGAATPPKLFDQARNHRLARGFAYLVAIIGMCSLNSGIFVLA